MNCNWRLFCPKKIHVFVDLWKLNKSIRRNKIGKLHKTHWRRWFVVGDNRKLLLNWIPKLSDFTSKDIAFGMHFLIDLIKHSASLVHHEQRNCLNLYTIQWIINRNCIFTLIIVWNSASGMLSFNHGTSNDQ